MSKITLDQRLRYIDIVFECSKRASKILARVEGAPHGPAFDWEIPTPRARRIGRLTRELVWRTVEREGLPASLVTFKRESAHG